MELKKKKKLWRSKRNSQISKHTQKEVPKAHEVCKRATVKQLVVVWMREAHIETCLNFWSPAEGIVWEWLEVVALLEEGKTSRGQISRFQMPPPVPSDVQVSCLRPEMWVINCCFSIILACLSSCSPPRWWWSLSSRKCKPQINPSFYTLLWCFVNSNTQITKLQAVGGPHFLVSHWAQTWSCWAGSSDAAFWLGSVNGK